MTDAKLLYLKEPSLLWIHVVEWDVNNVSLLVYKHGVTLTERAAAYILATDTHIEPYSSI